MFIYLSQREFKKTCTEVPHFLHKWDKITENILTLDYAANKMNWIDVPLELD